MREKLKQIREENKLTQQELADLAKINRCTYTNIELGRKNPSFIVSLKIKKALNYYNDDIFLSQSVPKRNN